MGSGTSSLPAPAMEVQSNARRAAVMVQHPVADFDNWKAGFDAHEGARRLSPFIYHQAAMQQAGATSKPDVSYQTGGWSKQYD